MGAKNIGHFIDTKNSRATLTFTKVELEQAVKNKMLTRENTTYDLFVKICKLLNVTPRERGERGSVTQTYKEIGGSASEVTKYLRDNPEIMKQVTEGVAEQQKKE